ncbi:MAG: murein biosynthesis integral membrane protein MurJ [Gammaproteobacteria bacterium]|nr:murein biosynthesis integral membrane protein MurJ [Gammaproteobacteria bacterium]
MTSKLLRSTTVVGQMTLISRVLGFVRDVVIARLFGTSLAADAFFIAFKIPNLFRRLFAEGAFSQAFVPVLAEYREKDGDPAVGDLIDATSGTLAIVLLVVVAIGVIAAPLVIAAFAPGFIQDTDKLELATALLRFTFPYLFFISLTALAGSVLNTYGRFAVPAITPVLLNVSLIFAAISLSPRLDQPVMALAIGVLVGGIAQLALQLAALWRLGFVPKPIIAFTNEGVRKILRLMGPAMFGVSVAQINLMFDTLIASFLQTGSISWLYYSDRLVEFPLGVFGIALATVILPTLSARHSESDPNSFSATLDWALRWVFLIGLPAAVGLVVLAAPMLSTLFQYGALDERDVVMASRSLVAYSSGLMGFMLIKVLAPGFFARQDTRTPVRIGVIALVANMVMNLVFVFPLAHAGLALATALSAYINAALLFRALRRSGVYRSNTAWRPYFIRVGLAGIAMALVLCLSVEPVSVWSAWDVWTRAGQLSLWIAVGAGTYFAVLWICGLRPRDMAMQVP